MMVFNNAVTASNQLSIIANKMSITTDALSEHIQLVGETLKKLGIKVKDASGAFRSFGDVYQETYEKLKNSKDYEQKIIEPLRSETPSATENSNQKSDFNFLKQNVDDYIEDIFKDSNDYIENILNGCNDLCI